MFFTMNTMDETLKERSEKKTESVKGRTISKFHGNITEQYDQMKYMRQSSTFLIGEIPFAKNVQGIAKIMHEDLLLMGLLQTKPQFENRVKNVSICIILSFCICQICYEKLEISDKHFGLFNL